MTRHSLYELLMVVSGIGAWFGSILIGSQTSDYRWVLLGLASLVALIGIALVLHLRNDKRSNDRHRHF